MATLRQDDLLKIKDGDKFSVHVVFYLMAPRPTLDRWKQQ